MFERRTQSGLLSRFFAKKLIKNNKINLFGKAISIIDLIQTERQQVRTLIDIDLSHNAIQQLGEIKQFQQLQILNLTNNKISDYQSISKLQQLDHLHTLFIKNNSINKKALSSIQLRFLVSLNTDIALINQQNQEKIKLLVKQTQLLHKFRQFSNKIKLHCQLFLQKKITYDASFTPLNLLPKIKRYFEHPSFFDPTLRRDIIMKVESSLFTNEKELLNYLENSLKTVKKSVNQVLLQINTQIQQMKKIQFKSAQESRLHLNERIKQNVFRQKTFQPKENIRLKQESIFKFSPNKSKSSDKSNIKRQKSIFQMEIQSNILKTFQIQNQFTNILGKIHPSFQLLHSPLPSLKSHEKDLLIQQLLIVLKDSLKLNIKLKTAQQQNFQLREQIKELKKHLITVTNEVNQHQRSRTSILNELQLSYQQQLAKTAFLREKNELLQLENKKNEQTIDRLLEQSKINNKQNEQMNRDLRNSELIREFRQKSIKSKFFGLIQHKILHLYRLRQIKKLNQKKQQKQLKQLVIDQFKLNLYINHCQRSLIKKIKVKAFNSLVFKLGSNLQQSNKQKSFDKLLKKLKIQQFINKLISQVQIKRNEKEKADKLTKNKMKIQKKSLINKLKVNLNQVNSKNLENHALECRKYLLNKKMFRIWKSYITTLQSKTACCKNQYSMKIKKTALKQFLGTMTYQNNLITKSLALANFLPNIRKIKAYLAFTKVLSTRLLQRQINANKIKVTKKHTYFFYFLSMMKHRLIKKTFQKQQQKKRNELEKQKERLQITLIEKRKKIKNNLRCVILKITQKLRSKIFQRQISIKKLEKAIRLNCLNQFVLRVCSRLITASKYAKKAIQLNKYRLKISKLHSFFFKLQLLHNTKKTKATSLTSLKLKAFYNWKILFKTNVLNIYREKYHKIEDYVEQLTQKVIKTDQQHSILIEKMKEKEEVIQQYLKKCEELAYLLQSKQMKYQNLKAIYQETVENCQHYRLRAQEMSQIRLNSISQSNKNRFIKHMEKQIRKEKFNELQKGCDTTQKRYMLQKDRVPQVRNKPHSNQYSCQANEKTQRFSFISSFKRF